MEVLNRADIIAFLFIIYFTCMGWIQGILRFVLGLAALLISGYFASSNFHDNQDIMGSLKLFIALSMILSVVFWAGLNFWNQRVVKSKKSSYLSRLFGASIGFLWSLFFCISLMIVLVVVPASNSFWKNIKKATRESYLYTLVEYRYLSTHAAYQMIKNFFEAEPLPADTGIVSGKPITDIRTTPEYQAIYDDFRFQAILKDEKIKKYIEEKNIAGLVASQKIQDLLKDPMFIKKFQDLYTRILKDGR